MTAALQHFVDAQAACMPQVLAELRDGRKRSHWMWFVFPQIEGLGHSPMARRFALHGIEDARDYLRHPVLGPRLLACTALVGAVEGRDILQILGTPDDLKFCSCMTLFEAAAPHEALFADCLEKYFGGRRDAATLARLPQLR